MMTFKPHAELDDIDSEFRQRWADDLRTSKQAQGTLFDGEGGYCCLGRACAIVGIHDKDLECKAYPDSHWYSQMGTENLSQINAAVMYVGDDLREGFNFSRLNDEYLTHDQIADLLDGKEVTINE